MTLSDALPGTVQEDQPLLDVEGDDGVQVLEQWVLCGLNLTMFQAMINTPELMVSRIA